jgi:lysozyme
MQVDRSGLEFIRAREGLETHAYPDSGGAPTIGIGHLLTRAERTSGKLVIRGQTVRYRDGLTEAQCYNLLEQDMLVPARAVNAAVKVPLTQNQFNALVDFAFNVGDTAFRESTLLKLLNQKQYDAIPEQMRRWVHDNGIRVPGLVNRREKEIALWNT